MSNLLNQVKDIHEAHMGKRSIESVMKELIGAAVENSARAIRKTTYPDPELVTEHVKTHYKQWLVRLVRAHIDWKSWLVIEVDFSNLDGLGQEGIYNHVSNIIDEALWNACWTEEFDAKRYIQHLCEQRGYMGEPGMSQQEEDDLAFNKMRAGNFEEGV